MWLTLCGRVGSLSLRKPCATDTETSSHGSRKTLGRAAMNAQQLLQEISDYCRSTGLAEATFRRRAVNDGKLASRLRNGGRITTDTLDRIHGFMAAHPPHVARPIVIERFRDTRPISAASAA